MNQLTKMFEDQNLIIVTNGENHEFLLRDLCNILELGQTSAVKRRLDDDVISNHPIQDSLGRTQTATFVNEDGLYDVILDSRKKEAKQFRKWITSEVIPSIRKTGGYIQQDRAIDFVNSWLPQLDDNSKHAVASTLEQNKHLVNENKQLVTTIETQKPKVVFADAYEVSEDSITIKEMANLLKQKGLDTGEKRLYIWLRENGYVCKKVGGMYNLPTQRSLDLGILEIKKGVRTGTGGALRQTRTTKITGKGQIYFVNKLLPETAVM
ncbi:phage antirepressor [Oceanobacillus locisalsi]|uniref:Phage antirepressor n=1 Tax=Oceanobacillus locisalsi TaxID=546107 RepID=A0ABW3NJE1_9BACI